MIDDDDFDLLRSALAQADGGWLAGLARVFFRHAAQPERSREQTAVFHGLAVVVDGKATLDQVILDRLDADVEAGELVGDDWELPDGWEPDVA